MSKKMEEKKNFEAVIDVNTSSVEIKKTSKGVNIGVKIYNENPRTAQKEAVTIFDQLNKKYKGVE